MRTDSLILWGPIRVSVVVSVVIFLGALIAFILIYKKNKAVVAADNYTAMFDDGSDDFVENDTAETIETVEEKEQIDE